MFYQKEYDQGYACSETDYRKYTSDFENFLKWMTRAMWVWFLIGMPIIIGLAIWDDYEINTFEKLIIISFPLPFMAVKGWKVFNAPDVLMVGKRPIGKFKNQKEIMEARLKGLPWGLLNAMVLVPIIGSYVFLNDDELVAWEVILALCTFMTLLVLGIYFIIRKWKIHRSEEK